MYQMRLLQILKKKPLCNEFHFILIAIMLLMLSIKYYFFIIFLVLYLIYIFKYKHFILTIVFLILIITIRILITNIINNSFEYKDNYDAYVIDIKDDNSYYAYIGLNKVLIYDYNHDIKPGDKINLSLKIIDNKKSYENDFDNEVYLKSKGLSFSAKAKDTKLINHGLSINSLKYYYLKYLSNILSSESFSYVNQMVFGNNNMDSDIKEGYSVLGISHILAISGLHILFLFKIISFILLKVFHYYDSKIPIILIAIYVLFIGIEAAIFRALLFLILNKLNDKSNIKYTKLDILSISFIIMIIFRPYFSYNTGFILSFLVSFVLIYANEIIKKTKSNLINSYKIYILIFLFTFPFVININNTISLTSLILSPILSLILSFIILPITYLITLFPILDYVFKYLFIGLNNYVINLKNIMFLINIKSFNVYLISIYYLILGFLIFSYLKRKHYILMISILVFYIIGIKSFKYVTPYGEVTFIDVDQGDSILVRLPYSKKVMLIDAYNSFDYLKREGIDNIDYLVLTHSDNDHIKDYKKIINYFNVDKLIYPIYDEKFKYLLKDININAYGINDNYKFSDLLNLKILGPINKYDDPNSNSIVIKLYLENKSILFTGDMTEKEENDLIKKYKKELKSNVLKVGHHGSKTSTSKEFLDLVNPDISVISVGLNNSYNLPDDIILERLKNTSKVYMTKDCGNITYRYFKDKNWIKTYR